MNDFLKSHGQLLLGAAALGIGQLLFNRFLNRVYEVAEEAAQDTVEDIMEQMNEVADGVPDTTPRVLNSATLAERLRRDEDEQ
jgi:hypothetical protein